MEFLPGFYLTSSQSGIYLASISKCTLDKKRAFRTQAPANRKTMKSKQTKHRSLIFHPKVN